VFSGAAPFAAYIDDEVEFNGSGEIWAAKFFTSQKGDVMTMINKRKNSSARTHSHSKRISKLSTSFFVAGLLLVGAASGASAESYRTGHEHGLAQRGYYGTPYGGGPQYGNGGGDQYGYGPGYSYARQAPSRY
jgi:hypothetical protein